MMEYEIIWEGKMEPSSPSQCSLSSSNEELMLEDDFANDLLINEYNIMDKWNENEQKRSVQALLLELQESEIKYSDELRTITDRANEPIYDFVSPIEATTLLGSVKPTAIVNSTEDLLMEFDSIYDAVELTHLTPPQTPPGHQSRYQQLQEEQIIYEHSEFIYNEPSCSQFQSASFFEQTVPTLSEAETSIIFNSNASDVVSTATEVIFTRDIAHELEVVDEIVRSRSQDLPDWTDDDLSSFASSASLSPRSETSSFSPDYDDWKSSSTKYKSSSSGSSSPATQLKGVTKKRTRPYARGTEDKKSRKKEQNKNAATRYRQKKKQEVEVILDEERILADKNQKLFCDFKDKKREVNYLKGLLREIFKAKGIIQ